MYEGLVELRTKGKKNADGKIRCTLLGDIGQLALDEVLKKEDIFETLDYIREC